MRIPCLKSAPGVSAVQLSSGNYPLSVSVCNSLQVPCHRFSLIHSRPPTSFQLVVCAAMLRPFLALLSLGCLLSLWAPALGDMAVQHARPSADDGRALALGFLTGFGVDVQEVQHCISES